MLLKHSIILTLVAFSVNICASRAQSFKVVQGSLIDSNKAALPYIKVQLADGLDTLSTTTDSSGTFRFKHIGFLSFSIHIKSILYEEVKQTYKLGDRDTIKLQAIVLRELIHRLEDVTIRQKVTPFKVRSDTIEYNALFYNTSKYARLKELVSKLPGLNSDFNGNLIFRDELITELRVNGKTFFSGNVQQFLDQLPAAIVSKIEVIDDYGNEANFTGRKTGPSRKIINVVTKLNINRGRFGNIGLNAGLDKRYGLNGNGNFWEGEKQIALNSNITKADNKAGISTVNSIGATHRTIWKNKIEFNSAFNYKHDKENYASIANSETTTSSGLLLTNSINHNSKTGQGYSINSTIAYRPTSSTYLNLSNTISLDMQRITSNANSVFRGAINQDMSNSSTQILNNKTLGVLTSGGHHFRGNGGTITASLLVTGRDFNYDDRRTDQIHYKSVSHDYDSTTNRLIDISNTSFSLASTVTYTKKLKNNSNFDLSYQYNQDKQKNKNFYSIIKATGYLDPIDSLNTNYDALTTYHLFNADFRFTYKKLNVAGGINGQHSTVSISGKTSNLKTDTKTIKIWPIVNIQYESSNNSEFKLKYSTSYTFPNVNQLQPIADTRSLQNVIIGNTNLKPSTNHLISLSYSWSKPENQTLLQVNLSSLVTQDQIVINNILKPDTLGSLRQETRYLNANGGGSNALSFSYSVNLYNKNQSFINLQTSGDARYTNSIFFTNNVMRRLGFLTGNQSTTLSFSSKNFTLSSAASYDDTRSISDDQSLEISPARNFNLELGGNIVFFKETRLNFKSTKKFSHGYGNGLNNNQLLFDFGIFKSFFKNKANVSIQVNDIFNQGRSTQRIISTNTVSDVRVNKITRLVLINLAMRLEKFGQNKKTASN